MRRSEHPALSCERFLPVFVGHQFQNHQEMQIRAAVVADTMTATSNINFQEFRLSCNITVQMFV